MGIELDQFDKTMLHSLADSKEQEESTFPYLFGILSSSVDLFVSGHSEKRDLESIWASVKLLARLCKTHDADDLRAIASGAMGIPGEDV